MSHSGTGYFWRMSTEPCTDITRKHLKEERAKWQDLNFQSESEIEEHYTEVKVSEGQRHENIQYSNLSWRLFLHFWLPQYDFIVHTLNISKTINWISILYKYWHLSRHNIKGVRQKQTWNYNHYQGVSKLPPPLKRVMISIAIVSQWCNTFRIVLCFFILVGSYIFGNMKNPFNLSGLPMHDVNHPMVSYSGSHEISFPLQPSIRILVS